MGADGVSSHPEVQKQPPQCGSILVGDNEEKHRHQAVLFCLVRFFCSCFTRNGIGNGHGKNSLLKIAFHLPLRQLLTAHESFELAFSFGSNENSISSYLRLYLIWKSYPSKYQASDSSTKKLMPDASV